MFIGIHCEAAFDDKTLRELMKIIAKEVKLGDNLAFKTVTADGPLTKSTIEPAISLFADVEPKCSFAIFVTDADNIKGRYSEISKVVEQCLSSAGLNNFGITACPDPVIEQWFLDEENGMKQVLSLPGDKPLPYDKEIPKNRYHKMIKENKSLDITKTDDDIHIEIVRAIDMKKLKGSNKSFNNFYESVYSKMKFLKI